MPVPVSANSDLWVFGYGSLMWRPGFDHAEQRPARLHGAHRALCIYSFNHRGTPEKPGLVLGLDRGGSCRGVAFRVPREKVEDALAYLRAREQISGVYRETLRRVDLLDDPRARVQALCYIADRSHVQYAGELPLESQLHHVRQGHGRSGANRDYVIETAKHLRALGIRDPALEWLAARL